MKRKISRGSASSKQTVYRLKNWSAYNKALIERGSICVWLDEDVIAAWSYVGPKQRGAQFVYSNLTIQTALTFRKLFSLPLRQTQGFLQSLFDGMHLKLRCQIIRRSHVGKLGLRFLFPHVPRQIPSTWWSIAVG